MYRALESERPDALFHDPYARRLAGSDGDRILREMPRGRTFAWPMVVRTVIIDELITQGIEHKQVDLVVNLAAGFDTRPYRMALPSSLQWVEVDYPQTIEQKTAQLAGEQPQCKLERIGADLADDQTRAQVFERINSMGNVGLVITEGLMVYLKPEQVSEFAKDLARQAHFRYWIVDIVAPFIIKMMRRTWGKQLLSAPFLFAPEEGAGFYERLGWRLVSYRSTWREAHYYKREAASAWVWRLLFPRAWLAEKNKRTGPMTGVLMLERAT